MKIAKSVILNLLLITQLGFNSVNAMSDNDNNKSQSIHYTNSVYDPDNDYDEDIIKFSNNINLEANNKYEDTFVNNEKNPEREYNSDSGNEDSVWENNERTEYRILDKKLKPRIFKEDQNIINITNKKIE